MKNVFDIFEVNEDPNKVKEGCVLVSEPLGRDLFFKKSVIIIVEHNSIGSVGFVINKPYHISVKELIPDFMVSNVNVSLGGPVEPDTLHFLHGYGDQIENSKQIAPGLYWGGDFEQLQMKVNAGLIDPSKVRFFIGYSGWTSGQLADEIEQSHWIVSSMSNSDILNAPRNLWENCVQAMGERFKPWLNTPDMPAMN